MNGCCMMMTLGTLQVLHHCYLKYGDSHSVLYLYDSECYDMTNEMFDKLDHNNNNNAN